MCDDLRALQQSVAAYAGRFDARALSPAQAAAVVRLSAQIEASAASIKALAAARVADGKGWEQSGYRSAADQLADTAGMSPGSAKRALETGRRMADQPEVAAAALSGELSLEQAAAVSDGVAADPGKAASLIDKAKRSSMPELNEEVARVKAAKADPEARRQAIDSKRSLKQWTDRDGARQGHLYGHIEDGIRLDRMLDPIRRRFIKLRHDPGGPRQNLESISYDALMVMVALALGKDCELSLADLLELGLFPQFDRVAAPPEPAEGENRRTKKLAGGPFRVHIRVDLPALLRGVALDGETCEIAGYGPVPVAVVEDLLATENPFIVGLLTNGRQLTGVYHHGRHPNAFERSALDFIDPICAAEGCSAKVGLQYDHRQDFAKTHITAFDLLDRLCPHHHGLKTRKNWALVDGRGKRAFVPPDDPRHPARAGPTESLHPARAAPT